MLWGAPYRMPQGSGRTGRVRPFYHGRGCPFSKPLDTALVLQLAREHEVLITIEEGSIGGFGSFVLQALAEAGALDRGIKFRAMVLPDIFINQDSPNAMYAKAGLDARGIVTKVFEALARSRCRAGEARVVPAKSVPRARADNSQVAAL